MTREHAQTMCEAIVASLDLPVLPFNLAETCSGVGVDAAGRSC